MMCVGVPMKLLSMEGIVGKASDGERVHTIDLSLTQDALPDQWVLTFLGTAREVISEDEARKIAAALEGLRAVMSGETLGDAFADLEERGPQLPPHLQAALASGRKIA